jgi:hypothetical protein
VTDWAQVEGKAFQDKPNPGPRFKFSVDVWMGNAWQRKTIFTGTNFCDPNQVSAASFIPKLVKLVRACDMPLPMDAQQAAAWTADCLIGKRFGILMSPDPETGKVEPRFVRLAQAPVLPRPPERPAPAAPPAQQFQPPAPTPAPPQYAPPPDDPFVEEGPPLTPDGTYATAPAVTGPVDAWK